MSSREPDAHRSRDEAEAPPRYAPGGETHLQKASPAAAPGRPDTSYPKRAGENLPAGGQDPRTHLQARRSREAAWALGILGITVLPLFAPFALWQANKAERLGEVGTGGKILGWVGVIVLILYVIGFIMFAVFFGAVMSTFPDSPSYSA